MDIKVGSTLARMLLSTSQGNKVYHFLHVYVCVYNVFLSLLLNLRKYA